MTSKGNQATLLLQPEPQGSMPLTTKFIRGSGKQRKEQVTIFYHKNYKAFGLQYSPKAAGTAFQVASARTVKQLILKLNTMGFKQL